MALRWRELPRLPLTRPRCARRLHRAPPPLLEDLVDSRCPPVPDGRLGDAGRVPNRGAPGGGSSDSSPSKARYRGGGCQEDRLENGIRGYLPRRERTIGPHSRISPQMGYSWRSPGGGMKPVSKL